MVLTDIDTKWVKYTYPVAIWKICDGKSRYAEGINKLETISLDTEEINILYKD